MILFACCKRNILYDVFNSASFPSISPPALFLLNQMFSAIRTHTSQYDHTVHSIDFYQRVYQVAASLSRHV